MKKLIQIIERRRRIRTTRNELNAMSDRDLADIGINRFDIPEIARSTA